MNIWLAAPRGRKKAKPVLIALAAVAVVLTAAVPATARTSSPTPVLAQGAGMGERPSPAVRKVQRVLNHRGYDLGAPGVDGRFGPLTDAAVRRAQSDQGLVADGVVGLKTRRALGLRRQADRPSPSTRGPVSRRPATRKPAATRNPAATRQPAALKPHTPSTTKPGRPAEPPQPQPTANTSAGKAPDDTVWVIAGVVALLAFCVALVTFGRRGPRRPASDESIVSPIGPDVFVEGQSADPEIGEFHGRAVATRVTTTPGGDAEGDKETAFLVDDPRMPAPVWVQEADVRRSPGHLAAEAPVIGYVTLPRDGRAEDADEAVRQIAEACEREGWLLVDVVTDRENGRGLERPGLSHALRQIAERKARGLVVTDLRRLSSSSVELGALMEWLRDADAALVALDLGVDTSTPAGQALATTLITLSGWERECIARRLRTGVEEVRDADPQAGRPPFGARRPARDPRDQLPRLGGDRET